MSKLLELMCAAKINLSLDVTGKKPDGYHTLESIFQSVTVYDTITLTVAAGEGITISCPTEGVPCDEHNLAYRAAAALLKASGKQAKIDMYLTKGIPSGAGMGGGSADAAGVLYGLNDLLDCGFSSEQLREIGAQIGADVPFLLLGGTALAKGIGEMLTPLRALPETLPLVIVKGSESISTPAAYRAIDALEHPVHLDTKAMLQAVEMRDTTLLCRSCGNLFEQAIDCPDVTRAKKRLLECGAECAVMTGSGAAVFGIFPECMTREELVSIAETLGKEFVFARAAHPTGQPFIETARS